jgi:hypothetical protein
MITVKVKRVNIRDYDSVQTVKSQDKTAMVKSEEQNLKKLSNFKINRDKHRLNKRNV